MAKNRKPYNVLADTDTPKNVPRFKILGTFTGECVDSQIVNENDMLIGPSVWEYLFASDEFKRALKLGHYIGFLGHPEDPGCQDFKNACIVMTEGHIEDDGRVYGSFNLVDTPVGRIVKAFIDAGVQFGISVRGAGDLVGNSVEAETFIFRGFDLVTFPAYPNSIPVFQEIAASKDLKKQQTYQVLCSTINSNIDQLHSISTIDQIQNQVKPNSHVYMSLSGRKRAIAEANVTSSVSVLKPKDIDTERLEAMTKLFMSTQAELQKCKAQLARQHKQSAQDRITAARKLASVRRITSDQVSGLEASIARLTASRDAAVSSNKKLRSQIKSIQASSQVTTAKLTRARSENEDTNAEVDRLTHENLKYKQTIAANKAEIERQNSTISSLRSELRETVTASKDVSRTVSNRDKELSKARREIEAKTRLLEEYQDAYSELYASAIGVNISGLTVTASTSVDQLKRAISSDTSISPDNIFEEPDVEDIGLDDVDTSSGGIISC